MQAAAIKYSQGGGNETVIDTSQLYDGAYVVVPFRDATRFERMAMEGCLWPWDVEPCGSTQLGLFYKVIG